MARQRRGLPAKACGSGLFQGDGRKRGRVIPAVLEREALPHRHGALRLQWLVLFFVNPTVGRWARIRFAEAFFYRYVMRLRVVIRAAGLADDPLHHQTDPPDGGGDETDPERQFRISTTGAVGGRNRVAAKLFQQHEQPDQRLDPRSEGHLRTGKRSGGQSAASADQSPLRLQHAGRDELDRDRKGTTGDQRHDYVAERYHALRDPAGRSAGHDRRGTEMGKELRLFARDAV
ncbi:hypothetical protein D3C74_342030 [compost metagenome]